jgi:serine/threonine protein kinase
MAASDATSASSSSTLVDRLAAELERRWRAGERPVVEDYLVLYPELADQPEAAVELIYEELCLRQEHGEIVDAAEVLRRFPQWQEQLRVLVACHHFLEVGQGTTRFPVPGETFGDFRLLAELGRGGQGRVFLATQPALASRPVVLKLTPRSGQEHLSLARLQHTHIVPLYSMQDESACNLRVLCMPYFGSATLAQVLRWLCDSPPAKRTGRDILDALQQAQAAAPVSLPMDGPACRFLARASYVQAICWLGSCLADALHYSHERGLVHLDLKPSNVLWAADGQPMLLDLHLARRPISAGAPALDLGGTPAYMAPEQAVALAAVQTGRRVPAAVDGRADVYALALLLAETLGGGTPPTGRSVPRWLRQCNPQVSIGLADVLGKCLADDPRQRYPDAAALADDLRRHLANLPFRGVVNRSLSERWRKWRRRRPHGLILLGLVLAVSAAGGLALGYIHHEEHKARAALAEGRQHLERRAYGPAREAWQRGLAGAEGLPFASELANELRSELRLLQRAEGAQQLHRVVDRLRSLYGADGQPAADVQAVEAHCRSFWDQRLRIADRLGAPSVPEHEQVRIDLLDLGILWSDLRVRLAAGNEVAAAHREVLEVLGEAEALFGPSCVLEVERQVHERALGLTQGRPRPAPTPRTAWEHYALGRALFHRGDLEDADTHLEQAIGLEPQALWPHFYKGACAYRRGRHEDAVLAFTACTVLAPQCGWCYHNRGLAFEALGDVERAGRDFDRARQLDPGVP